MASREEEGGTKKAVITLQPKTWKEEDLVGILSTSNLALDESNDMYAKSLTNSNYQTYSHPKPFSYYQYSSLCDPQFNQIKVKVIYPAENKHIQKVPNTNASVTSYPVLFIVPILQI